jgi:D-alanine-D-alanine ligase
MTGTVVGVLRGGPSREHDVSLKTGAAILSHLPELYTTRDLYIDRAGQWHDRGRPVTPTQALGTIDVALIGLHGEYGEDGDVQRLLEKHGVPYAGADSFSSFLAMHKALAKHKAIEAGILVPRSVFIEHANGIHDGVREAVSSFMQPVVVKPVRWGSSVGVTIRHGFQPVQHAVASLFDNDAGGVLIEELIRGTEATVGVVENLRGESLYTLPAVEIIPPQDDFFSYDSKYSGATQEIVPGRFPRKVSEELARSARTMHEALGVRHYSRSDFIVSPRGIYYLETNTLPGLTEESLFPKSLAAVGIKLHEFLQHLITLAHAI